LVFNNAEIRKIGGSSFIDQLTYTYTANSNKLSESEKIQRINTYKADLSYFLSFVPEATRLMYLKEIQSKYGIKLN